MKMIKKRGEDMRLMFRAVLLALLDMLEHGEADRAAQYIQRILADK